MVYEEESVLVGAAWVRSCDSESYVDHCRRRVEDSSVYSKGILTEVTIVIVEKLDLNAE
jgi:hypothetical protein